MNSQERTEILAGIPEADLLPWLEILEEQGVVEVIHPANMGLVMTRAKETVADELFHVGELLTTDTTITLDGVIGYGVTMGNDEDKAYILALIDALFRTPLEKSADVKQQLNDWLKRQAQTQRQEQLKQSQLLNRTKVDFELMDND